MPLIRFLNPTQDPLRVSPYSRKVLEDAMKKSGVAMLTITSTARTGSEQARVMYENLERHGVTHQKKLYGPYGDAVIDVYSALKTKGKPKADIIAAMTAKIYAVGPSRVSRHVGDPNKVNVVDIAPNSISLPFKEAI